MNFLEDEFTKREIEMIARNEDDLKNMKDMSLKQVQDMYFHVEMQFNRVLNMFYNLSQKTADRVRNYDHCAEWSEASGNYRHRFAIFYINNDYVLSIIKITDPIGHDRYAIAWRPVSLNNMVCNEKIVMKYLAEAKAVKYIVSFNGNESQYSWDNYYNDVESSEYLWKSKFRSKYSINKMSGILRTEFKDFLYDNEISDIVTTNKRWEKKKKEKSTNHADVNLIKLMCKCDSVEVMMVYYQDKLVSFSILSIYMGKYINALTTKAYSVLGADFLKEYLGCDDKTATLLAKKLDKYHHYMMHYHYLKEKGYDAIYYFGDMKKPGLKEYKKSMYKKVIYYNKVPLNNTSNIEDLYYEIS